MHRRAWKTILFVAFILLGAGQTRGQTNAAFVKSDTTTQGNWHNVYGGDGYWVSQDSQSLPSYASSFAPHNQSNYTWASSTTDVRALQNGANTGRLAACWYAPSSYYFDLNITDANTHQFALYALDWDTTTRTETIQIVDASTNNPLDSQTLTNFHSGVYLVWNITGHVKINVTNTGSLNAVVSGVFFGGSGSGGGGANANFLSQDTATQGNWQGVYGGDGYSIANDPNGPHVPSYATFGSNGASWTWSSSTSDVRALQNDGNTGRLATCWYSSGTFTFDVNFTDANTHRFALYAVDWDSAGRSDMIQIVDANTSNQLDSRTLSNFSSGSYFVWNITGHVKINVTSTGSLNAVVSGVFFGGSGSGSGANANFLSQDTATQGNWQGVYGGDGYSIANDPNGPHVPSYATFGSNGATWTWSSSTSDVRALQNDGNTGRLATCWYSSGTFTFDVNFTDANTHRFALYAVDWDSAGRSDMIQIVDANTSNQLDSRTLSNFSSGSYFVWNITGHVKINVTSTGSLNAVVSGVFFGGGGSGSSPSLSITKTHTGNFTLGQQNAAYSVTVSNAAGVSATSGTVTVTETAPSGLTLVSMAGTGWSCATNSCNRSDSLSAGASYPVITVTVNVASNASSPQVNQVSVSGGGSATASTTDSTTINSPGPSVYYYIEDQLGTSRVITTSAGTICYDADFYPYGGERSVVNTCPQNYKFTGKERDGNALTETGLDNFGARYYSSVMARFMSPDPAGGKRADPQTLNRYSYVRNNPLKITDPTGLYLCADDQNKCKTKNDRDLNDALLQLRFSGIQGAAIAAAYGQATKDNGVTVDFKSKADMGKGNMGITDFSATRLANGMIGDIHITVDFLSGLRSKDLEQTVAHEGSHIQDDMSFFQSFDFLSHKFNSALNFYQYDTEFKAFEIGAMVKPYRDLACGGDQPCGDIVPGPRGYANLDRYLTTNPQYVEHNNDLQFDPKEWPQ